MGKTKTKTRSVGDSPKPPITIRSTNVKILDDNIAKLEKAIQASDVSANPSGTAEETLLSTIGIDGKKYELGPSAENTSYDNTDSGLTATDTQSAIDEIAPALTAEGTAYDNTDSGLSATDTQEAIDEVVSDLASAVPCQLLQIPNIGEHTSIRLQLADSDTFCVATFIGTTGTYAQFIITAASSVDIVKNGYSITKNADRDFTITCTGNWTRGVVYAFAPVPNAITYSIIE